MKFYIPHCAETELIEKRNRVIEDFGLKNISNEFIYSITFRSLFRHQELDCLQVGTPPPPWYRQDNRPIALILKNPEFFIIFSHPGGLRSLQRCALIRSKDVVELVHFDKMPHETDQHHIPVDSMPE